MNVELFNHGLQVLGDTAASQQLEQFKIYAQLLVEWNQKMNLTAITDADGIAQKHFLDSILPLYYVDIPQGARVADIGTGAGFPGLPVKIMRPDLSLTLMDALNKRITFLKTVVAAIGVDDVLCILFCPVPWPISVFCVSTVCLLLRWAEGLLH